MRFDGNAYRKVFPKQKVKEQIESAVESFTPTQDELEGEEGDTDADGDGNTGNNATE